MIFLKKKESLEHTESASRLYTLNSLKTNKHGEKKSSVIAHDCHPSTWKAKAVG